MSEDVVWHAHASLPGRGEESVAHWASVVTRQSQERLLESIRVQSEVELPEIAESLGISVSEACAALDGEVDLTLTEVRLLAIASKVVVTYNVKPARSHFFQMMRDLTSRPHRRADSQELVFSWMVHSSHAGEQHRAQEQHEKLMEA